MKIKIIIPYFGQLPSHMDLFLESCRYNTEFDFLFFTDSEWKYTTPSNVKYFQMSFAELQKLAEQKIGKGFIPTSPYKLCDFKPTYGLLFQDFCADADYWGVCDIDLVFGRISNFLSMKIIQQYEKLQLQGHFILIKNTKKMNSLFMKATSDILSFSQVVKFKEPCFFDEIFFPVICRKEGIKEHNDWSFADILPQYADFRISKLCSLKDHAKQYFYWNEGHIHQVFEENGRKYNTEAMYIHFQKRIMDVYYQAKDFNRKIYLLPSGFWAEDKLNEQAFCCDGAQVKNYTMKRWKGFNLNKIWIKYKVMKAKRFIV